MSPDLKSFKVPDNMKHDKCLSCGKPGCDVLVIENIPGGGIGVFHHGCLNNVLRS